MNITQLIPRLAQSHNITTEGFFPNIKGEVFIYIRLSMSYVPLIRGI